MSGPARRLIESRGTPVQVIDIYREWVPAEPGYSPTYIQHYYARQKTNAVLNRAGDFTREFVTTVGQIDTQTLMAFFAEANRQDEPAIRDEITDVPTDEQLSIGADPSKDEYGPTILRDLQTGENFDVVNIIQEQTGVRRVQSKLRSEPFELGSSDSGNNNSANSGSQNGGSSFY